MKKKLLFVQLPIPRLTMTLEDHNIPVAAFYLQSYLLEQRFAEQLDIQVLPPVLQNYGADETLLHDVLTRAPDIICFSLFCWNVERSLSLAERIKQQSAAYSVPLLLAGGPEVTPDNPLLHTSAFDLYVYGEGEYSLALIVEQLLDQSVVPGSFEVPGTFSFTDGEVRINPPQEHAIDINSIPSAYLSGLVPRKDWSEMFFESMRGCPFSCRFCYYNKNCGPIRFLNQTTILELLQYAITYRYREIFLLDPSFNIRPELEELLTKMATLNSNRQIRISTELRADMVDEPLARLLAEAGVYEVELGLQSIHPDTIQQIGRTQHLKRFLQGTRTMLGQGIETKVDLIVGLPGDNLEKFKESARWVKREGLNDYLQVFCLSVLPGTYFRAHAEELALNYSPFPPYYLISSPDWSQKDIQEAFSWTEDYFGITFEPDIDEKFSLTPILDGRLQESISVDPAQPFDYPRSTTSITKWLIGPIQKVEDLTVHLPTIQTYTRNNPYGIYYVYLDLHHELPLDALFDFYLAFKSLRRHFIDRDFSVLSIDEAPIFHYQVTILVRSPLLPKFSKHYLTALRQHFYVEIL